jgi:hypothetical protein
LVPNIPRMYGIPIFSGPARIHLATMGSLDSRLDSVLCFVLWISDVLEDAYSKDYIDRRVYWDLRTCNHLAIGTPSVSVTLRVSVARPSSSDGHPWPGLVRHEQLIGQYLSHAHLAPELRKIRMGASEAESRPIPSQLRSRPVQ